MNKKTLYRLGFIAAAIVVAVVVVVNVHKVESNADTQDTDPFIDYADLIEGIAEKMENSSGTIEGLQYAEQLYVVCDSLGDVEDRNYALVQKLTMLHALARYDECVAYADSLVNYTRLRTEKLTYYYMAIYVKMVAYIDLGKYKSALQIAQKLYDDSRVEIIDETGQNIRLLVRCNSIMGLGMANDEMGRTEEAIGYYTEGINSLLTGDKDKEYLTQLLEMQTCRMMAGKKISDKRKALSYIKHYQYEFSSFKKQRVGTLFERIFVDDYDLLMRTAFIDVYTDLGQYDEARQNVVAADSLLELYEMADQYIAELNVAKAHLYEAQGDYAMSVACADSALRYYSDNERHTGELDVLKIKLSNFQHLGLYSYEYPLTVRILALSDSIYHHKINSQVEDMQTILDLDKLEHKANEMKAQRQLWIFIALAILFAATSVIIIFKRRKDSEQRKLISIQRDMLKIEVERQTRQLRKQNEDIEATNVILAQNNEQIEKQNKEIRGSIEYALLIQQSILPRFDSFTGLGNGGCFTFYVPCRIVSGDFYWYRHKDDKDIIVLADCTGHGVPGAFMTMIGTTILGDICDRTSVIEPAEILEQLHINLLAVLQQNGEQNSSDGMDAAILVLDRVNSTITVASAKRPVLLYHNGVGQELEGVRVKRSVGDRDYDINSRPFTQATVSVTSGDAVYLFSDGFTDAFGGTGAKKRRFASSRLKEMMDDMCCKSIQEQKKFVEDTFYNWISAGGSLPEDKWDQPDDVSFMGVIF